MAAFSGFPRKYFTFFNQLKKNNTTEWFEEHRSDYEEFVMHPAREFVIAMGKKLRKIAPGLRKKCPMSFIRLPSSITRTAIIKTCCRCTGG